MGMAWEEGSLAVGDEGRRRGRGRARVGAWVGMAQEQPRAVVGSGEGWRGRRRRHGHGRVWGDASRVHGVGVRRGVRARGCGHGWRCVRWGRQAGGGAGG